MLRKRFVIARYSFDDLFRAEADKRFVDDLMSEPFLSEKHFDYAIGNMEIEKTKSHVLHRGTFGRMRKGSIKNIYDKKTKQFKKKEMPETADTLLEFIIDHSNHLMLVEHSSSFSPSYFLSKFKAIYEKASSFGELQMDFIFIQEDVYKTIHHWDRIEKVTLTKLRPSNPSSLPDFKEFEALLKETKSKKTKIEFSAQSSADGGSRGGLDANSKLIKQGISLSAHGYGEAKIQGEKNSKDVEVRSQRFMKKIEVNFSEDGALEKITQIIEEIQKDEKHDK